jgi:hypothetical protein
LLKREELHAGLIQLLRRLRASVMFCEPHQPGESRMRDSFRNYGPAEFAAFVKQHGGFTSLSAIGCAANGRQVFKLVR